MSLLALPAAPPLNRKALSIEVTFHLYKCTVPGRRLATVLTECGPLDSVEFA